MPLVSGIGAAPHLPAGILSPYSDGRGTLSPSISPIASVAGKGVEVAVSSLLPVTIRGEVPAGG
ncbi:MAG: hypothetical protein EOQ29_34025 [Mesorhizobium sp.]|nr:MAG: hypothetical protein EOQ29_34025 [Mesorhizobium sp.]